MDYEKKYKDALERAKEWCNASILDKTLIYAIRVIEEIFPELKESEDERIRRCIGDAVRKYGEEFASGAVTKEKMLVWLEKQGEQKPTYKVEPKFKVGDWIVYETEEWREVLQIETIEIERYTFTDGSSSSFTEEQYMHLWTIDDARDGDVLASRATYKDDIDICIFKSPFLYLKNSFVSYCSYFGNRFESKELLPYWNNDFFIPATKKQRDLLFQKMKEAGYEWDAEKKRVEKDR